MTSEKEKLDYLTTQIYIQNPESTTAFDFIHRICEYELAKLSFQLLREPINYSDTPSFSLPDTMRKREIFRSIKGAIEDFNRIRMEKPNLSS